MSDTQSKTDLARARKTELQRLRREEARASQADAVTIDPDTLRDNLVTTLNGLAKSGATVTRKWLAGQEKSGRVLWPPDVTRNGVTYQPWR